MKIRLVSQVVCHDMILDDSVVLAAEVALSAVVSLTPRVELNVQVDLGIARIQRRLNFLVLQIKQRTLLRVALLSLRAASKVLKFGLF